MIEWTVSIGSIIAAAVTIIVWIAGAVGLYFALRSSISLLGERLLTLAGRMINVENELKSLSNIITVQAVQTSQISAIKEFQREISERFDRVEHELRDRLGVLERPPRRP